LVDHLVRIASPENSSKPVGVRERKSPRRSFASLHAQWLYALATPDAQVRGDLDELARLAELVRQWRRPVDVASASSYRLCFRLEEPNETSDRPHDQWHLRYLLQGTDDPSLIVPVTEPGSLASARPRSSRGADSSLGNICCRCWTRPRHSVPPSKRA
jgi:hypothetical protein